MVVFLICRVYWRDREEVNFRKLEFWTKLGERKKEKDRERESSSSGYPRRAFFPTSLRVFVHYLLSLIYTCVKNVFAPYIDVGFFFFYMWSIVMVLTHDSYRIKIP